MSAGFHSYSCLITCLVTAVLIEKLFTCPQSAQNRTEDFQWSVLQFHPEIL